MRFRLHADVVISAEDYRDALKRIGEHFSAWAADTPTDDPDTWRTDASLTAPQFEVGGFVHLTPQDD